MNAPDPPPPDQDRWAAAIQSAEAHVRADDSGSPPDDEDDPTTRRKVLLGTTGVVVTLVVALGVQAATGPDPAGSSPATLAADLRLEAAALVEQIEAYRTERGELPEPSFLSPFLDEGYEYEVVNEEEGRYLVRRSAGGVTVTYDGSLPLGLWTLVGGSSTESSP